MNRLVPHICQNCNVSFESRKYRQKYCSMSCGALCRWRTCKESGVNFRSTWKVSTVLLRSIGSINKNEVYRSARRVYLESNPELVCAHCGINDEEVIDIAHVKAICEFPLITLLGEINQISNLLALCKNCHWKFDKRLPGKRGNRRKSIAAS